MTKFGKSKTTRLSWTKLDMRFTLERGRGCRPEQDNRLYFEGMMWITRTGAQWRASAG